MTTEQYWAQHYYDSHTPWDMGSTSPPLTAFFQNLTNKKQQILIPGAGNAHEAEWLWHNGFENIHVADIAAAPLKNLKARVSSFPENQLVHKNFFEINNTFDLVIEQTFFCALQPSQRKEYILKMKDIITAGGSLVGVLFNFPLTVEGPPFGGSREEYEELFSPYFKIYKLQRCYNSIPPRQDSELFFHLIKP